MSVRSAIALSGGAYVWEKRLLNGRYTWEKRYKSGTSRRTSRKSRASRSTQQLKRSSQIRLHALLTVAAYLYRKTGRSWFVGTNGVYLSLPPGVLPGNAASRIVTEYPEIREYGLVVINNQVLIRSADAHALARRLVMRDDSIRKYCQNVGARSEQRQFGRSISCDPWLANQYATRRFAGHFI